MRKLLALEEVRLMDITARKAVIVMEMEMAYLAMY